MQRYRKATNLPEIITKTLRHLTSGNTGDPKCLKFGVPTVITTKFDGTQLVIRLTKNPTLEIEIHGHSSKKPIFKGSLEDFSKGQQKGPKIIPYAYQKVPLYPIVSLEIPKFLSLMNELGVGNSDFYCELILPEKSPLNINYREDLRNKLYLFTHTYQIKGEYYRDEINP